MAGDEVGGPGTLHVEGTLVGQLQLKWAESGISRAFCTEVTMAECLQRKQAFCTVSTLDSHLQLKEIWTWSILGFFAPGLP